MVKLTTSDVERAFRTLKVKGLIELKENRITITDKFRNKLNKAVENPKVQATIMILKNYLATPEVVADICLQVPIQFVIYEHLKPLKEEQQKVVIVLTEIYKNAYHENFEKFIVELLPQGLRG